MSRALASAVLPRLPQGRRALVAIAGAPGSGKSTLAEALAQALELEGRRVQVVPMDGFHLDNRLLEVKGLLHKKGAPETFDLPGFAALLTRLRAGGAVVCPLFDRSRDVAMAGALEVSEACDAVILEGNYLLFDQPGWRDLAPVWDLSIRLQVPQPELRQRLVQRWIDHGLSQNKAEARADGNDMLNARLVADHALPADLNWPAQEGHKP